MESVMSSVNIHEAKTHLSRLLDQAAKGDAVVIAKAGKPVAKLTAINAPAPRRRLGFLAGEVRVPDDFDRMGEGEISGLFGL